MNALLVFLLGGCTGLRTMTPVAALCWFVWLHELHVTGWRSFTAHLASLVIFTVLAAGEYVGDKLPSTPARTGAIALSARLVFGAVIGVLLAQPLAIGTLLAGVDGLLGALCGAYAGYFARTRSVRSLRAPDWTIAVIEDALTIAFTIALLRTVAVHSALLAGNTGL